MKTEAALLVQTGKPLVLAQIEIPALKPGQALVEISYSGACGTQVMEWRGDKGEDGEGGRRGNTAADIVEGHLSISCGREEVIARGAKTPDHGEFGEPSG